MFLQRHDHGPHDLARILFHVLAHVLFYVLLSLSLALLVPFHDLARILLHILAHVLFHLFDLVTAPRPHIALAKVGDDGLRRGGVVPRAGGQVLAGPLVHIDADALAPPKAGAGLPQVRRRRLKPPSHVLEQAPQSNQTVQLPWTVQLAT